MELHAYSANKTVKIPITDLRRKIFRGVCKEELSSFKLIVQVEDGTVRTMINYCEGLHLH